MDINNMNSIMKEMYLGGDARSTRGILSRGRNVYKGGAPHAKTPNLKEVALKRLRMQQR